MILREKESEEKYQKFLKEEYNGKCIFCDKKSLLTLKHWGLKKNDFPYDRIAKEHYLFYPLRHVDTLNELTMEEIEELEFFKNEWNRDDFYDMWIENSTNKQSQKHHLHYHLIKLYE